MKKVYLFCLAATTLIAAACGGDDGWSDKDTGATNKQQQEETSVVVDSTYKYRLPVIFHVLYQDKNDDTQYIPAARLKNLLQYVNRIYQGGIYGESVNVNLNFVLAEKDENGKTLSTPGVEYVYYSGEFPIDEEAFMSSADNVKYIWDPNEYINVMLYPFKNGDDGEVLGISHLPYTVKGDHEVSGLETVNEAYIAKSRLRYPLCSSINSTYASRSATGGYYQSDRYTNSNHQAKYIVASDIVVTLAHELGHYLGLFHPFTEDLKDSDRASIFDHIDSCEDTDYCKDTPSYNRKEYSNYLATYMAGTPSSALDIRTLIKRHACDGTEFSSANIMDYAFTLGYNISPDQKARIRNVLYYSPLIPGPKLNGINKRTRATDDAQAPVYTRPRMIR